MLGKLDIHMQKNEIEPFALWHTQKSTQNQLKWLTHKTGNYKTRRKQGNLHDIGFVSDLLDMIRKAQATK